MARMKKEEVIKALQAAGVNFDADGNYNDLCKLLKANTVKPEPEVKPETVPTKESDLTIRLESRIKKKNIFLADSYRNEKDAAVLNKEIGKREHKGKIKCITTIKRMEVTMSGDWLTEFVIELK